MSGKEDYPTNKNVDHSAHRILLIDVVILVSLDYTVLVTTLTLCLYFTNGFSIVWSAESVIVDKGLLSITAIYLVTSQLPTS